MEEEEKGQALTERQRYWLEQIQACEASGKTVAAYAAAHGLNPQAMYAGKKALVNKGVLPRSSASRFQRAEVIDAGSVCAWRIQLPNGVAVDFSGTVDGVALATVLTVAARLE